MAFKASKGKPKSARGNRKEWRASLPPHQFRIKIRYAIEAAGNSARLAKALGLTRGAVYQWSPPYRHDPYMPLEAAIRFTENKKLMERYNQQQRGSEDGETETAI